MNNFIIYSIEIAISLALFYTAYWVFLKNETFFRLNRFYIIFSVIISLLTPLINITVGGDSFIARNLILPIQKYEQGFGMNLDNKFAPKRNGIILNRNHEYAEDNKGTIGKSNTAILSTEQTVPINTLKESDSTNKTNWLTTALLIYFIGASLFLIRFIANFIWIFGYIFKNQSQQILGMKVIRFEKNISPFSFLNFIFISKKEYPEIELNKIISHEKVHINQKHSIDLIMFELLLVFQWFNPFVWLYKSAIKITHEYLADEGVLNSGIDLPSYQYSLLNQVLRENNFEIASSYNFSVKKRISMMLKKKSSKLSTLKLIIPLPILVFLFSAFAFCTTTSDKDAKNHELNKLIQDSDTTIKRVNVPIEYLKLIEGEYVSTNEPGRERRIIFTEVLGTMYGFDNGYCYKIIPVGEGKFINPADRATLKFDTKNKNAISLLLFGKINLNKVEIIKGSGNVQNRSMGLTLANVALKSGIPAMISYHKLAKDSSNYYLNEGEMNIVGYDLLNAGKTLEAAAIFKLITELFSASFNAYDSYADALLVLGDKKLAIENIKKSLELNPGSKYGLKKLKELGLNPDEFVKPINVPVEELRLLEGVYLSTNQPTWVRKITLKLVDGVLTGEDNGYNYKLIPMGNGKFINPDDGASLVFDTKDKNAIGLSLFGTINLKKIKASKIPTLDLKEYSGLYFPAKKDTILRPMEILNSQNKLFRFIENPDDYTANRNIELEFVTGNIFFYPDNSNRSIEFIVNDKKEVTGCILRRWDGIFSLSKQKY